MPANNFAGNLDDDIQKQFRYAGGRPMGMVRPGNIDLNNRPVVHNPDGSVSTELSFSNGTDQGEMLVPQVVNGRIMPQQAAWQHAMQTGQNMGTFESPEYADSYAMQTHNRPDPTAGERMSRRPMYTMDTKPESIQDRPKKFAHARREQ